MSDFFKFYTPFLALTPLSLSEKDIKKKLKYCDIICTGADPAKIVFFDS